MLSFSAPGRVNLIGEHTDYTGGFVLPMAIDFATRAAIKPSSDGKVHLTSRNFQEEATYDLANYPEKGRHHWSDYPAGVIKELRDHGVPVEGLDLELDGDVPLGAGLSSSASVEVATAVAVLQQTGFAMPPAEIALLCQSAENNFVGGSCGIMDQFVITNGRAGHALLLDCRSLDYELLKMPEAISVVICNSMVQHTVAHGEYGDRRGEVERGQTVLAAALPSIKLLRDATLADLESVRDKMPKASFDRCKHIITENGRVLRAREALMSDDLEGFGQLMYEAHASFRDDFAASCPEVDLLVELASHLPGCYGARITGGGFGGCTVNIVESAQAPAFRDALVDAYLKRNGIRADAYISRASDGAMARLG